MFDCCNATSCAILTEEPTGALKLRLPKADIRGTEKACIAESDLDDHLRRCFDSEVNPFEAAEARDLKKGTRVRRFRGEPL